MNNLLDLTTLDIGKSYIRAVKTGSPDPPHRFTSNSVNWLQIADS